MIETQDISKVRQGGRVAVRPLEGEGPRVEAKTDPLKQSRCGQDGRTSLDRPEKGLSAPEKSSGSIETGGFESRPHRQYTVEEVRALVGTRRAWAERAILVLYRLQTSDEQRAQFTKEQNGVGFNNADSPILSSFAVRILGGRPLTEKQLAVAFKALPKYAKQLHKIASAARNGTA